MAKYRVIKRNGLWVVRSNGQDVAVFQKYADACGWVSMH